MSDNDNVKIDGTQAGASMTPEQLSQANAYLAQLDQPVRAVMVTVLQGLLHSFPGVPAHAILSMAAMHSGLFMGSVMTGELATLLKLRKGFEEAFKEGVRKTPPNIQHIPAAPLPPNIRGN
jgi:hypothetical protein